MFCMGCGAEVPARAVVCPVCGRDTGRGGDARGTRAQAETIERADATGDHSVPRERSAPPARARAATVAVPAGPSIGSGDLDQSGFPRDALGRSLIFTVLAMAADLLAPWINLDGNRIAPSSLGLLPVLGLVWLALAVLPLLRPPLRATPLYAVAPLVVGATSLGVAVAVWMRVTLLASQSTVESSRDPTIQSFGSTGNSADVGLYLFLAGAVVLIIAGYQIFLAAARAEMRAELRAEMPQRAPAHELSPGGMVPSARRAASDGRWVTPSPASAAAATTLDGGAAAAIGPHVLPPPLHPAPALPDALGAPGGVPVAQAGVALPGSAAWNQTPHSPDFQRPSPIQGWRRRGH